MAGFSPDAEKTAIWAYFTGKGLSSNQAAGIIGNLQQESGLNPSESNGFLAQWLGSRLSGLQAFAAGKHVAVAGNTQVQLDYIWQELNSNQAGTLAALKKTKTPQEAARVFSAGFEKPLASAANVPAREKYATEAASHTTTGTGIVSEAEQKASQLAGGLGSELISGFGKIAITGVLLLAGAVLVVYGIMVAVRPRESAFSLPMPALA